MKKIFLLGLLVVTISGCSSYSQQVYRNMYPERVAHQQRNEEIEAAFAAGEISRKEYLEMKLENDKLLKTETATVDVYDR